MIASRQLANTETVAFMAVLAVKFCLSIEKTIETVKK